VVNTASNGAAALEQMAAEPPDAIVLDVTMPGIDGFALTQQVREISNVPIIMLTAMSEQSQKVRGLETGADDYLTKPFELAILIARIQGLLRRREWLRASLNHEAPNHATENQSNHVTAPPEPKGTFTFGEKSVHFDLLELRVRGQKFPLTLMEANVLRYLIQHEGAPVSRKAMLEDVWALHEDTDTRAIDNFIVRLRRYIEDDPTRPRHLLTVRGVGYRFVASPAEAV